MRELELALRPSELEQLLRVGLGGLPWKNQGCSLMLLVLLLLAGGTATLAGLAGLDAGRRVLERLAEAHRQNPRVAEVRAEMQEEMKTKSEGLTCTIGPRMRKIGPLQGPED